MMGWDGWLVGGLAWPLEVGEKRSGFFFGGGFLTVAVSQL